MTSRPDPHMDQQLDAYLDNQLEPTERAAFEARLAASAELRARVALQQSVDAALRNSPALAAPEIAAVLGRLEAARRSGRVEQTARRLRLQGVVRLATAAGIILAAVGGGTWATLAVLDGGAKQYTDAELAIITPRKWQSVEEVYRERVAQGFKVDWRCDDEKLFGRAFLVRFDQALLLKEPLPKGVKQLGLSFSNTLSSATMYLLAKVDDRGVAVFVDKRTGHKPPQMKTGCGLRMFSREIGDLVLYEVTPLSEARVLDLFYDPQKPREWFKE